MVSEQSEKISRKTPLMLQSTNRSTKKLKLESKANIVSSDSLSQSSKWKANLNHTRHQHQQQHVSGQEEIGQELDIIGALAFERAQLEERVLGLEQRVRGLETQRERDVKMLLWMRVEMARFGEWWRWVERGRGEGLQENEGC
ncbi:hypothetical protein BOTCAL_0093g00050 [Botryotinia calthae]|uniref:Uncharacterized protein n=1 Tax=Botryotinia calthae TaxID=38488 RepID=A0A4Y8D948_9HELO|nr:hypothetical protein BOTCAL_0093g00050 [Botryotinia calthae]